MILIIHKKSEYIDKIVELYCQVLLAEMPLPAKNTGDIYFFTYAIVVAKFNFTFELAYIQIDSSDQTSLEVSDHLISVLLIRVNISSRSFVILTRKFIHKHTFIFF